MNMIPKPSFLVATILFFTFSSGYCSEIKKSPLQLTGSREYEQTLSSHKPKPKITIEQEQKSGSSTRESKHFITVRLATGDYPPYTSSAMKGYGLLAEIVTETLKEMGAEPKYSFFPWARCEALTKKGEVWASFPYGHTEERAKQFLYSDVLFVSSTKFFYYKERPGKKIVWEKIEDLKPYRIGGVLGYYYENEFKHAGLKVFYVYSESIALKTLRAGRVDIVPLDEAVGWHLVRRNFPQVSANFKVVEKAHETSENYLIVSKKYPNSRMLLKKFNAALKSIKERGGVEKIILKNLHVDKQRNGAAQF